MYETHRDLSDDTNQSLVALAIWKRELKEDQKCNKIIMEAYGCTEIHITRFILLENEKLYEVWKLLIEIFQSRPIRAL